MTSRSFIQRTCVVLGLLAISAYLFYVGKEHTLFLDTKAVTIDGKEFSSYASASVSVNGKSLNSPMGRAERVRVTVSGPSHTIEILGDAGAGEKTEKTFTIPTFMDRVIVSIPAILGGAPEDRWITPFEAPSVVEVAVERIQFQQN